MTARAVTRACGAACLGLVLALPAPAAEPEKPAGHASEEHSEHTEHGEHDEHGHHRHHLAVFIGDSRVEGEDSFTLGVEYEHRLRSRWAVGAILEHAAKELDADVLVATVAFHPRKGWKLLAGPGVERAHGDNEFLVRVGVAYEFEVGKVSLGPVYQIDFVDDEEIQVFGLNVGWGF